MLCVCDTDLCNDGEEDDEIGGSEDDESGVKMFVPQITRIFILCFVVYYFTI